MGITRIFMSCLKSLPPIRFLFGLDEGGVFGENSLDDCRPGFYSMKQMERDRDYLRRSPL